MLAYPGARWKQEDESKRKRKADARKRRKATTKWEGIRQKEASVQKVVQSEETE